MSAENDSNRSTLEEAEEKLKSAVHTGTEKVTQVLSDVKETVSEKYKEWTAPKSKQEEAQDKAQEAKEEIRKAGSAIKESMSAASEAISEKAEKIKEEVKE
ncbi:hypothetical protein Gasu2_19240 [Galdieria sulphuraria]|uniref:Uncharacterized protein n=1 Tax=Galdieria sulphuraria TaxID=130081 RepID=M2XU61_GALSU|nr:uncharacterized protein Gasu_51840 [Galdieria sulphuraria]EME27203.1 hypothetical protein Gasu_51840 [Galdieria sulphuraria]GJD07572.1 hypothetical protein Gasu2_19240 [Galdieria sulphuraria]|eukprot:XP_005703723.1 hypothetical protein Gasu_51840 [Galdieria sulphuraria]